MMMSRTTDSGFRWRHELQAGIECGVDLAKLSPQATLPFIKSMVSSRPC